MPEQWLDWGLAAGLGRRDLLSMPAVTVRSKFLHTERQRPSGFVFPSVPDLQALAGPQGGV